MSKQKKFKLMSFSPVGHPMQIDSKEYSTRIEADIRKKELASIYDFIFISES